MLKQARGPVSLVLSLAAGVHRSRPQGGSLSPPAKTGFTSGAVSFPQRFGGSLNEHCVSLMGDGTWTDHRCDEPDGYVCEWDPPSAAK